MAVYSKLLLSAGGGIVSTTQQAEQVKNTATVLIGLGGTGIDALRTIKTQVYSRLKADDPDAVVPGYQHIRFLGVDTAEKSKGDPNDQDNVKAGALMALDDTESFSISNSQVKSAFSNPKAMEMRDELKWLSWEKIDAPDLGKAGAGGIRQVGRYMMMDKSKTFMDRVEQEINAAKVGLNGPTVNIHIFSGLSGGTGAGCFLDVCYMVRHIAGETANIFGYFFMPDVNLAVIPHSDKMTRSFIPQNGYAAMQELDYCMQLQYNGGGFTQMYQDHIAVEWKKPPVDMAHLICATNAAGDEIANAYDYAMNVTAEYVLDFLTYSNAKFDLEQQLSNFRAKVTEGDRKKTIGSNLAYCVIGASCASIPLREINTYLASELFGRFSCICQNVPTQADVEKLAVSALARDAQSISDIYNSLYYELREGFDDSYAAYADDWKFVRDYGNKEMVTSYTNQTASKLNFAEKNAKSMTSVGNQKSLIGRVDAQMRKLICNINYGPMFAYGLVSAARSHNLLNVIAGLIAENNSRWDQEAAQTSLRQEDYDRAKSDFDNRRKRSLFDTDAKRFGDYEYYLMLAEQHKLAMSCYEKLDQVLDAFRKQLEELTASYYIKLSRVVDTLVNTFKENRDALASEEILQTKDAFSIPMMTIAELKNTLDAEIEKINVPGMLDAFMRLFLENEEAWLGEDENKIAKMVNTFFVKTAFGDFANRTITSFLKDKYGISNDAQLANKIYNEWMKKLTMKASPLFYFNNTVWSKDQTAGLAFLSFPAASAPIKAAAEMMYATDKMWCNKESALTDRIYVMCSACALPLSAYKKCEAYENSCFSSTQGWGRHYYEGKTVPGMLFNDWRKLSPLTPQKLLTLEDAPYRMRECVSTAQELFDEAKRFGIFDSDNCICEPEEHGIKTQRELIELAKNRIPQISKAADLAAAQELLGQLKNSKIPMVATKYGIQNDGYAKEVKDKIEIQKDHFVSAPAYHIIVKKILDEMKSLDAAKNEAIKLLEDKITRIGAGNRAIGEYCDALFTGVITLEGYTVVYRKSEFGIVTETVLSKRDDAFAFRDIPVYQGFLSYQSLLDDDTRTAIKKTANDRYNSGSSEIKTTGTMLKEELADNKVQAWVMRADNSPEKAEIVDFIMKVKQQFNIFCMENDI